MWAGGIPYPSRDSSRALPGRQHTSLDVDWLARPRVWSFIPRRPVSAYMGTVLSGGSYSMTLIRAKRNASALATDTGAVMWLDEDHFMIGPFAGSEASQLSQDRLYEAGPRPR